MLSIRTQLLRWTLGALSLGAVILGLATYAFALDEMNEVFDEQLKQVALTVLTHAETDKAAPVPAPAPAGAGDLDGYAFVTQVWTLQGKRLSASAVDLDIPFVAEEGFRTVSTRAGEWRVYTDRSASRYIQAAQSMEVRHASAAEVALQILIPSLLAVPLLALLLAYALRRGLLPLARTAEDIGRRSGTSLEPIDLAGLSVELRPLVVSINMLLDKLARALTAQRQLTADAAHELRTPLTALRLQVQALTRAGDTASRNAAALDTQQGLRRASHLVEQLLSLSRVDPEASSTPHRRIDLEGLAKATVTDFSSRAEAMQIDLGADIPAGAPGAYLIDGDREQLQVLLNNLVDNALRYTACGGRVDVCVRAGAAGVSLAVADSGPGLPPAERERVFDRFYRGSTARQRDAAIEGSGLGLAIVKAAAARHRAVLEVTDGLALDAGSPGLTVRATFTRRRHTEAASSRS